MDKTASPIKMFKEINLTKGFSSWHVKWPIGILGNNFKRIAATLSALGENVPEKDIIFYVGTVPPTELPEPILQVGLIRYAVPKLPLFFRLALCYEGEDPIFGRPHFLTRNDRGIEASFLAGALKPNVKMTVHCWIDIPDAVLKKAVTPYTRMCTKRKYCGDDDEFPINIANFAAIGDGMFKGVTGEDKAFQAFSDVTLVPKKATDTDERRFFCHRTILAARSSVFLRMFAEQSWKEGEDRVVEIEDIDAETMEIFLYHIYTGKFKAAEPNFLPGIVYAADKYHLNDLKDWAVCQLITGDFSDADRADQLLVADRHNISHLKAACIAMLSSNTRLSRNDEICGKLSKELLMDVLDAMGKRQLDWTQIIVTTADEYRSKAS